MGEGPRRKVQRREGSAHLSFGSRWLSYRQRLCRSGACAPANSAAAEIGAFLDRTLDFGELDPRLLALTPFCFHTIDKCAAQRQQRPTLAPTSQEWTACRMALPTNAASSRPSGRSSPARSWLTANTCGSSAARSTRPRHGVHSATPSWPLAEWPLGGALAHLVGAAPRSEKYSSSVSRIADGRPA